MLVGAAARLQRTDCPEQTTTSPIRTSVNVTELSKDEFITMESGVEFAGCAGSSTKNFPAAVAVTGGSCTPRYVTAMVAPDVSKPHNVTGVPR